MHTNNFSMLNKRLVQQDKLLYMLPLIIIGAILRFYDIGGKSVWGDEVNSLLEASNLTQNLHSLLYFSFMHFWTGVSDSIVWNRIPAAVFGILCIVSIYYLIEELSDKKIAGIAALLLALNSFHIGYSQEIRFYSLFFLTSSLCFLFLFRFLRGLCNNIAN